MPPPTLAGTMQTDPRSGGVKRKSGVNVLPCVSDAWTEVRDDKNPEVDWILIGYDGNSKTDLKLIEKGNGGLEVLSAKLETVCSSAGGVLFGGTRLNKNGRFVQFVYADENCPAMKKGRTLMYKNGVFNVLVGCDGEIEMKPGLTEADMGPIR
mmetsp:Transcript_16410/g.33831  ORF Transcript_16410/g.33831 Transcript_16410/m.33831 type:complete len:153 (-) Transcript_16410:298-756(-)